MAPIFKYFKLLLLNKIQRLKNKYNTFERGESMKFKFSIKLATISLIGNIIIAIGEETLNN